LEHGDHHANIASEFFFGLDGLLRDLASDNRAVQKQKAQEKSEAHQASGGGYPHYIIFDLGNDEDWMPIFIFYFFGLRRGRMERG